MVPIPTLWCVLLSLLVVPQAPAPADDGMGRLQAYETALEDKQIELLALTEDLVAFKGKIAWNDLMYINSAIRSANVVSAGLYYQTELAALYGQMAERDPKFVRTRIPRMLEQIAFTRNLLSIEFERLLYQYAQTMDFSALKKMEAIRTVVKESLQILEDWHRTASPPSNARDS